MHWRAILILAATGFSTAAWAQQRPGDLHSFIKKPEGQVEFSVITNKGYVSFAANSEWKTVEMKTKPPVTAAVFQVPNSADEGTPDSSNVVVMSFERGVPDADTALARLVSSAAANSKKISYGKWDLYLFSGLQEKTPYQVRDAFREFPGATVYVRMAWPQLPRNTKSYDELMDAVFRALLDSVKCGLGSKPLRSNEVLRRPNEGGKPST